MKRVLLAGAAVFAATFALVVPPAFGAAAPAVTVYDSTVSPLPGNVPSVGAEAYSFTEFGDAVTLGGTARTLNTVTVTMSSWACQSGSWNQNNCLTTQGARFSVPITLNIYGSPVASGATVVPGTLIKSVTQTFGIPYRPSVNLKKCTGAAAGKWFDGVTQSCVNGKAVNVTFNLKSLKISLPDTVVLGVSYDTTHYGPSPIGESAPCYGTTQGCPYDSLNVGLNDTGTQGAGSQAYPGTVFQNAVFAGDYCDGTPATGVFNLDSPTDPCWAPYVPAFKITAR